jgi:hypothetical protein
MARRAGRITKRQPPPRHRDAEKIARSDVPDRLDGADDLSLGIVKPGGGGGEVAPSAARGRIEGTNEREYFPQPDVAATPLPCFFFNMSLSMLHDRWEALRGGLKDSGQLSIFINPLF